MSDKDLRYWIALKWIDGVGNVGMKNLIDACGSPERVFSASPAQLKAIPGIGPKSTAGIKAFRDWDKVDQEIERARTLKVTIMTCADPLYPANLLNIYDFPTLLYVRGRLQPEDVYIAIVGSRRASTYGRYVTERLGRELALKGIVVVSGMARGIDSAAHRGALAGKGSTVAVLGCGLDIIYPPENKALAEEIAESGAVITEFPFGTPPSGPNFPARNRIISGMSLGVVVVEATDKSGSLITARIALEQGREVFAVPGSIDSNISRGSNRLIKEGAKLIENVEDILDEIAPQIAAGRPQQRTIREERSLEDHGRQKNAAHAPAAPDVTATEQIVLDLISKKPVNADSLITASGIKPAEIMSTLMTLELKGLIRQLPGKQFVR